MKRKNCIAKACFFIFIFLVSIISCEVGLGSAVDTEPPSVAIDGPKVDAVIRDVFAITGRWSDDGSISEVKATLKRTNGNAKEVEIPGEWNVDPQLKETGTWKVLVDYEKENLVDGTYQATVSVKDNGKHVTTQSTTFTIDNTAPVLVLSRPSIKEGQSGFDNYGRSFTLEGKAADDNEVSLIEVNVFENADSTEPLKTVELRNVPLTIEQDVAVYNAAEANDYAVIYGHTDVNGIIEEIGDTEQRYCTVRIYDAAERYPVDGSAQTEADKKGNSTDVYYMNSEITSLLQSGLKITDLYHIMNGNYNSDSSRSISSQDVVSQLNSLKVTKGKFSINPANNPKYIVTSVTAKDKGKSLEHVDYQLTAGNRYIEIEITPGLDGFPIEPDTVGLYLQECYENGEPKDPDQKIWLINTGAEYHKTQEEADEYQTNQNETYTAGYGIYTISGSTYKFKTTKTISNKFYDVASDRFYLVKVVGNDSQGEDSGKIIPDGTFGFKLVSNEERFELKANGNLQYLSKNSGAWNQPGHEKLTVELTWTTSTEGPFILYRQIGDVIIKVADVVNPADATEGNWKSKEEFTFDQLQTLSFPTNLDYFLKKEENGDKVSIVSHMTLKYDTTSPKVSNVQISNSYEKKEKIGVDENNKPIYKSTYFVRNVSGNECEITGVATDETGLDSENAIQLQIPGLQKQIQTDGHFDFTNIDFSTLEDRVTAIITVMDCAGNTSDYSIDFVFDTTAPAGIHEIDAKGKDLYFRIGDSNNGNGSKYSKDSYGNTNTIKIRGKFDDKKYVENPTDPATYEIKDTENASGVYMIYYKVFESEPDNETLLNFETNYDSDGTAGKIKADGYFKPLETSKFANVDKNLPNGGKETINIETTYEATISGFDSTENYLSFVVVDNVGNAALERVKVPTGLDTYAVYGIYVMNNDTDNPTAIQGKVFEETLYVNSNSTENLKIYGIAEDSAAGVDSITVKVNEKLIPAEGTTEEETSANGTIKLIKGTITNKDASGNVTTTMDDVAKTILTWTENNTEVSEEISTEYKNVSEFTDNKIFWQLEIKPSVFNGVESGNISVYATIKDKAGTGNTQTVTIATVNVDKTPPTVTIQTPCKANETGTKVNKFMEITGVASDKNQIKEVLGLYYTTGAATKPEDNKPLTGWTPISGTAEGTNNWSFNKINTTALPSGEISITVAVCDNAGNIGYAVPIKVNVDQNSDRPTISFSNISLINDMSSTKYTWLKNTTKIIGTVSDDDGVESLQISLNGNDWKDVTLSGSSFSYDIQDFYDSDKENNANGKKQVYFKVKDKGLKADDTVGTEFTSTEENELTSVYITDGSITFGDSNKKNSILFVQVDTKYPEIILKGAKLTSDTEYTTLYNNIKLGGLTRSFDVKFSATDTNGMDEDSFAGRAEFVFVKPDGTNDKTEINCKQIKDSTSVENEKIMTFELSDTDVAALDGYDGSVGITIRGKDNAGNESKQTASISYDFKKEDVMFSSPLSTVTMSGDVTAYGGLTDTAYISFAISPTDTAAPGDTITKWIDGDGNETNLSGTKTVENWNVIEDPVRTWTINFDNNDNLSGVHQKSLNKYIIDYGIAEQDTTTNAHDAIVSSFEKIVKLYLWMKTVDLAGNEKIATHAILVDPQGDRPSISYSYPTASNSTIGGEVSIYGTATDTKGTNIGVDSVWVQIKSTTHGTDTTTNYGTAPSYNSVNDTVNFILTAEDLNYMVTNGYDVYKMNTYGTDSPKKWTSSSILETGEKASDYAALAKSSGAAWSLTINKSSEFDPPSGINKNPIAIRVFARDGDKKFSLKADRYVSFDADTPIIGDLYLVQSTDGKLSTPSTSSIAYSQDMFVKGGWYLTGKITDKDGIKQLKIGDDTLIDFTEEGVQTITVQTAWQNAVNIGDDGIVTFKYPLATSTGVGACNFKITAKDKITGTGYHTGNADISIYYDNVPPEIAVTIADGFNISDSIQQNNSWYTFGSVAKEPANSEGKKQSGFAYTAFYFIRDNKVADPNTKTLYDVLLPRASAAIDITGKTIPNLGSESSSAPENTLVNDSGLNWYKKAITRSDSLNTFTVSNTTGIRKNALVKIGGALYLITDVNGTSVTINGSPEKKYNVAYVAIAGIIDNTTPEGTGTAIQSDGYYEKPSRDDGDRMIESVDKSGTTWTWSASICSRNISDGPVELHYVVFDKAGNYKDSVVTGTVKNNAPRIAGAVIKSDYNGDGDVDDEGETLSNYSIMFNDAYRTYYTGTIVTTTEPSLNQLIFDPDKTVKNTNSKYPIPVSQEFGSETEPIAVLRGKTVIEPQIVGGNGKIYYGYKVTNGATIKSANNTTNPIINNGSTDYTVVTGNIDIQMGDLLSFEDSTNASTGLPFELTFWDSTEGTKAFDTTNPSQKAELKLYMAIQAQKVGTPVVKIKPFYWENSTKNSLYDNNTANGHIELEADWTAKDENNNKLSGWDGKTDGTTYLDSDPKVSGKITIEGTAHDDKLINTIKANIFGTESTVASYNGTELVSQFTSENFETNHFWFEKISEKIDSEGHDITWKLHINTATKLTEVAKANVSVIVKATNFGKPKVDVLTGNPAEYLLGMDGTTKYAKTVGYVTNSQKSNTNTSSQTYGDVSTQTAFYRMDVVPYITTIETALGDLKKNNPSVYSRTALGHYAVASGETITINGFNLSGSKVMFTKDTESVVVNYNNEIDIPDDATSGELKIFFTDTVNEEEVIRITSLNNVNNNDGKGSYAKTVNLIENPTGDEETYSNYYNRQPNGDNNNLLTDDVVMDIWGIDSTAVRPKIGGITQPVMNINPANGQVGFAFVNGTLYYSMPYGTQKNVNDTESTKDKVYSYYYWIGGIDAWTSVGFTYDEYGHSFGATAGGDINERKADQFRIMTSRWGNATLTNDGYRGGKNQLRLEMIGQQEYTGSGTDYTVYPSFNKERVQSPSLATTASDVDNTTVYLAYYDDCNDEIRFKWGGINDTTRTATGGFFADIYGDNYNSEGDSLSKGKYIDGYKGAAYGVYRLNYNSLIAGQTKDHVTATNGTKVSAQVMTEDGEPVYAGKYVSIAALKGQGDNYTPEGTSTTIKDDAIVAVWWDGKNNQLVYSYNLNPHGIAAGEYLQADTGWTTPVPIFATGIGEYCKINADSLNGIHIAAYDGTNSDVWYAYVADFKNPGGKKTCLVDSYGIIGTELNIDVALKNGKPIPYISYYANSCVKPKTAYLVGSIDSLSAGAVGEAFTAQWEISIIPTTSRVPQDHINIGVWKTDGELSDSINNENTYNTNSDVAANQVSYGSVWGNGTSNPILGYAITQGAGGYIETAQMK